MDMAGRARDAGQGAERLARRNALLLSAAQAIGGSAAPIAISMGGLAGFYLLGADKSLATAPVTGFNLGVAMGALPAAWIMRRIGRRYGFMGGTVMTAMGGLLTAIALFRHEFWLFAVGMVLVGMGGSFVQQYRFAAADASPTNFKAQAISWVLAGGIFAAVIGPQTVIYTREFFAPVMFAGSFAAMLPLAMIAAGILFFLRIPDDTKPGDVGHDNEPARPLIEIITQRRFVTAMICGVGSYALMTFMMTGAPLAMVGCGFSADLATLGIQWHVMAMFAPSFFTGRLIARFGRDAIVATGLGILLCCAVVAHMGIELWNFWLALVLLGLGWNFGFIGATAMVTSTYRQSEKNKVQGFHDVTLFSIVSFASLMSGQVLNAWGWDALNMLIWPVALTCLLVLGAQVLSDRRSAV
ncbi:putative MFS family arabinose efflux permease [Hoeflea marina]|uniref:Putative MFS family arabinose efflux permease n=1 Tax=Hoeflea marina TaxID=274592 RepID=A0A317PPI2_9HYPH|nr:MFS transporter [Hoeflea marina]PWW03431.1 putative MFS family arabinose efflux permease [Hoeflea marina]